MSDCVAVIHYNIMNDEFVLVSGSKEIVLPYNKALKKFVVNSPAITYDQVEMIRNLWLKENNIREE